MSVPAGRLTMLGPIPFSEPLTDPKRVSAIAFVHGFVLLVSDETAQVDVLRAEGDGFTPVDPIRLGKQKAEFDLEAVAAEGDIVYAVGSHSRERPSLAPDDSHEVARAKIATVRKTRDRDALIRFKLKA